MSDVTTKTVLDITHAAEYLRGLGFSSATPWTVRGLIADGEVKSMQLGRKFYVSVEDLNGFVARNLRRNGSRG